MLEFAQKAVFMSTYCLGYVIGNATFAPQENLLFGFFSCEIPTVA